MRVTGIHNLEEEFEVSDFEAFVSALTEAGVVFTTSEEGIHLRNAYEEPRFRKVAQNFAYTLTREEKLRQAGMDPRMADLVLVVQSLLPPEEPTLGKTGALQESMEAQASDPLADARARIQEWAGRIQEIVAE